MNQPIHFDTGNLELVPKEGETKEQAPEMSAKERLQKKLRTLYIEDESNNNAFRGDPLWTEVGPTTDVATLSEERKAQVAALNADYGKKRQTLWSEINALEEELKELELDEVEAAVDEFIKTNPRTQTLDQIRDLSQKKSDRDMSHYSTGNELMGDVHVVLKSSLKNEEKLAIIKGLSNHITSDTIGDAKSDLVKRYMKRLSNN